MVAEKRNKLKSKPIIEKQLSFKYDPNDFGVHLNTLLTPKFEDLFSLINLENAAGSCI